MCIGVKAEPSSSGSIVQARSSASADTSDSPRSSLVRYSGLAHFDRLIWPTCISTFYVILVGVQTPASQNPTSKTDYQRNDPPNQNQTITKPTMTKPKPTIKTSHPRYLHGVWGGAPFQKLFHFLTLFPAP